MSPNKSLRIGDREVGPGRPCYVLAEIGINHNGDVELATRAIAAAAKAGADGVKFQNFRTEDFISDRSLTYEYVSRGQKVVESQYDMFKRVELTADQLHDLAQECRRRAVDFISTPTSPQGVDDLVRVGAAALKNGSDYLGHLPLIRYMAQTGLTTIVSTGMATPIEVEEAVTAFHDAGGRDLILLHCVSVYPCPAEQLNLSRIGALQQRFGCPVGFSDHSIGVIGAAIAVTLGACMVEKHFTLDRNLPGPDHAMSSTPDELGELVRAVREAQVALGSAQIEPTNGEEASKHLFRLSCVAARPLAAGHVISLDDIAYQRPGKGLRPALAGQLVGRRLHADVIKGHVFTLADILN
jgi:N,N'-diacetyllegionaminate synthase